MLFTLDTLYILTTQKKGWSLLAQWAADFADV